MSQDESGTLAKHLLLQLQAQRARWLSSAAAGVPAIKKFTSSLHFVHRKLMLVYTQTEIVQTSLHTVYT